MARFARTLRKTLLPIVSPSSSSSSSSQFLNVQLEQLQQHGRPIMQQKPNFFLFQTFRSYISDMRKSAFEGNVLRLLRNEIQYELERSPPCEPVTKFGAYEVDDRPGEQWIVLKRKFAEDEDIRLEVTMFDGAIPVKKPTVAPFTDDEVRLHITLVVNISKGEGSDVLEVKCSAWPDYLVISELFIRRGEKMLARPYMGPGFKDLDDELQDALYEFLEARDINDELAAFLHRYMKNKDKTEFIRWMGTVRTYIEIK